jgi:hypothetical protein
MWWLPHSKLPNLQRIYDQLAAGLDEPVDLHPQSKNLA